MGGAAGRKGSGVDAGDGAQQRCQRAQGGGGRDDRRQEARQKARGGVTMTRRGILWNHLEVSHGHLEGTLNHHQLSAKPYCRLAICC